MKLVIALVISLALLDAAAADERADSCTVPDSLVATDVELTRAGNEMKEHHRLAISVIGTGSSSLPGSEGPHFAYPARLEDALRQELPGADIKVTAHIQSRATAADMDKGLSKILSDDKPTLVIWQAGTADALSGIEPDDFRASLDSGVDAIQAAGADVILMNMQYSPRTESMLEVNNYADVMRWVAQQHGALLFDRLGIMHHWNDEGIFDLYSATKDYAMARRVHDCIGRALASQIVNAAHLDAEKTQITR